MKLADIVNEQAIVTRLEATDRDAAVSELIDALIAAGAVDGALREELIERVLERESRGSTGFGRGVAVPHVKHPEAPKIVAAVGLSQQGIDFNSLDKQPVYSVFLLVSPAGDPEGHLRAMEVIFKSLKHETFRRFLRQATTVDEVRTLLEERDNQQLT
ncbi:MAG: PTS sugar transporter subunit IIA [Planctomycetota bacterium]|nr:MAG: PTS sugar transporter subunit IIA [Planctomycetota bacterium]